jgi:hypothetical protein
MKARWRVTTFLATAVFTLIFAGPGWAQNRCSASKIKVTAKKQKCIATVYAHAAQSSAAPKQADIDECEAKFAGYFAKLDLKGGCITSGDAGAIEGKVDAFVADLVTELDAGNPSLCQANKIKSAAKKASCLLALEAREAYKGFPKDPVKEQRCRDKFTARFAALELRPGCDTTGDAAAIEDKVDAFVADVDGEIPGSTTTTTTLP